MSEVFVSAPPEMKPKIGRGRWRRAAASKSSSDRMRPSRPGTSRGSDQEAVRRTVTPPATTEPCCVSAMRMSRSPRRILRPVRGRSSSHALDGGRPGSQCCGHHGVPRAMSLRFGVVGTAFWARDVHLPGLLRAKDAEVVGIWGRTAAPAQAIAAEHGIRAFPRFADLLGAVDAVAMAVPPEAQAELGLAAAKAGKHLILEKPVAMRPEAADAIADALTACRRAGLVFFTRRFVPEITAAIAAE